MSNDSLFTTTTKTAQKVYTSKETPKEVNTLDSIEKMQCFTLGLLTVAKQLVHDGKRRPVWSQTVFDSLAYEHDNVVHYPEVFYRVKVEDLKPGMAVWSLVSTVPDFTGMVYKVESDSGLTEIFYLTRESEVLNSGDYVFSCCNPDL